MNRVLLLALVFAVFGCATQLTLEGSSVRVVNDGGECKFIGIVSGSTSMGMSTSHDAEGAMNALRNKAAAMGANAIRIINVDSDSDATTAVAEALACEFD
jgi:uncharacterized protein YbjQ (UPF0145 family)